MISLPDIDGYYTFFDTDKKQWYTYTEDGSESPPPWARRT